MAEASTDAPMDMDSKDDKIWGIELSRIGILVAILCLIMCFFQCIYIVFYMFNVSKLADTVVEEIDVRGDQLVVENHIKMVTYTSLCLFMIFLQFDMLTSVFLIFGIQKKNPVLMLPWLITKALSIALKLSCSMCMFIFCSISSARAQTSFFIGFYTLIAAGSGWMWVFILIVYLKMCETNAGGSDKG